MDKTRYIGLGVSAAVVMGERAAVRPARFRRTLSYLKRCRASAQPMLTAFAEISACTALTPRPDQAFENHFDPY